jgi:hypothetical protein
MATLLFMPPGHETLAVQRICPADFPARRREARDRCRSLDGAVPLLGTSRPGSEHLEKFSPRQFDIGADTAPSK